MSDNNDMIRDDGVIAGEYALGLLSGEDLLMARGRIASDPEFAELVAKWEERLAPLLDEITPIAPGERVWPEIQAQIDAQGAPRAYAGLAGGDAGSNVIDLQSRLRRWQWTAGLTSAAAAVALAFATFTPATNQAPVAQPAQIAAADPLVAQVPIGDTGLRLDVTYIPESEKMLVGAIGLSADGVHDHELWLVPADGSALQSLGVVAPGEVRSMELPAEIARNLSDGVQLVLTREPIGGKPADQDAGPVVAEGAFSQV